MARVGTPLVRVAVVVIVAGTLQFAPYARALSAATTAPIHELTLTLTATQVLPPNSESALRSEATAIWKDSRIGLRWQSAGENEGQAPDLRVLVIARAVPSATAASSWTVGELVRAAGSPTIAIASITGARRIVDEAGLSSGDSPALRERRLGLVLGRAVAHEIGHYLLQTNAHYTHGLMRAAIDAREFADLRGGSFRLDDAAQAHLVRGLTRGLTPGQTPTISVNFR